MRVIVTLGQMQAKAAVCNDLLGVSAVDGVSGEAGEVTKIFMAADTVRALTTGSTEPWDADTIADPEACYAFTTRCDSSHDFMAWDDRSLRFVQFSVNDVQIGSAHAANVHVDQKFACTGRAPGQLTQVKRPDPSNTMARVPLSFRKTMDYGFRSVGFGQRNDSESGIEEAATRSTWTRSRTSAFTVTDHARLRRLSPVLFPPHRTRNV